ncbi:MAG: hypothetical protein RR951_07135 [Ruthenibacterium sp.]
MSIILWIILGILAAALLVLGILVLAAARASRSKQKPPAQTPTQQAENPYRKIYKD